MNKFPIERSEIRRASFALRRMRRKHLALVLAGSLLLAALPLHFGAHAQSRQADESLNSLIGLLREAESIAKTEMMPGELKSIREAANHARKGSLGSAETATEMLRVRTLLREIIDNPRGESAEFQEKIANSLKLVEDYLAMGDGNGLRARTDTAFGLITTTFDTLEGTVSVNLPDDVAAGDTISGTVIAEPKGATKDEQAKNEDTLNGYVVEVAKQETPPQQKQGSKWVIPPAAQFIPVVLKNRQGKEVARTNVPLSHGNVVNPKPNGDLPQDGNYSTPPFGQAGRPVSVNGPFDGDFGNTYIKLGNNTAQFLAESPRKAVFRSPANLTGPTTIEVNEQGKVVARCNYQSISVRLAADKLNLIRGEQTTLTLTVNGLNGINSSIPVQLTNASPWTIRMAGGESQIITAQPQEFTGGVFTAKRMLTGIKAGGFNINAVVNSNTFSPNGGGVWKTCDAGPGGGPHISRLNEAPASLRPPIDIAVTDADIQALDRKLNNFTRRLPNDEQAAMALLLRRAARAPMDEPLGTAVKVSFYSAGSPKDNPLNQRSIIIQGGRTTQESPYGTPGGRPPNPIDPLSAALGGDTDPLAIGPKHEDPATPRPDSLTSIGPKHEDPARPRPDDTLSIGPKHEDPARPRPDDTLSIGPKHEDPARPRPDDPLSIGPKHEDPMPAPDTINGLAGHLKDFSQQLSTPEKGMMDWLLQRASQGARGSESSYGTPGGRPPSPDQLQRADTNESGEAAKETGPPVGSPGGLPPLVQALGVSRRGDVNGAKRWLLRF
ncbi:MAG: hypothetical protein ABJA18_00925 [bacterium]